MFSLNSYRVHRISLEILASLFRLPKKVSVREFFIDDIPAEFVSWGHGGNERVILLFHGGGFTIGSRRVYRDMAWRIARAAGARVLVTDYHRAPESPFPVAHDEAFRTYQWLLEQGFDPKKIAVQGDSAGGSLALSLMQKLRKLSMPLPACCVMLSPWIDLALAGESYRTRKWRDPLLSARVLGMYSRQYLGTADPMNPLCSPLYGDASGLPPVLIQVGDDEVLLDDARRFAQKAIASGTDVTIEVWPDLFHVWHLWAPLLSEAREAIEEIGVFCREHMA
jgi:acetyl esterase/lipase